MTSDEGTRFWSKVEKRPDGCWIWQASGTQNGYGQFWADNRLVLAHRRAYETMVGPIPAGMTLDHLCRTTRCVNPDHLEPVTHRENCLRGQSIVAKEARRTHCNRGHAFIPENIYWRADGTRRCRTCVSQDGKAVRRRSRLGEGR
jgi:hypothetical protein